MEHRNKIVNPAFREGILEALGHKKHELTSEQKYDIVKDVEDNWWFCGGRDIEPTLTTECPYDEKEWDRLWHHYHGNRAMPDPRKFCVCSQDGLRYNLFITDGDRVLTIGSVCMYQFLPRIAKQIKQKKCDRCMEPHSNRKDNFCSPCRILNAKEAKEKEERVRLEEAEERERVRLEVAERMARQCPCGAWKKPEYPSCWICRQKKVNSMTEMEKKKNLCGCGKIKQPQYVRCFTCNKMKQG